MKLTYSLKFTSQHFKFLTLGVLAFLEQLKKKESLYFKKIKIGVSKVKKTKYTVLRSPFVNKAARDQFEVNRYTVVLYLTLDISKKTDLFLSEFVECNLKTFLGSQFLEIKLIKLVCI
jgi:hypothetical protein